MHCSGKSEVDQSYHNPPRWWTERRRAGQRTNVGTITATKYPDTMELMVAYWLPCCPAKKNIRKTPERRLLSPQSTSTSNIKLFFQSEIVKFLKNQAVSSVKAASSQIPIKIKKTNDH